MSSISSIDVPVKDNSSESKVTLEGCSNSYFAGYLDKKFLEKFKCDICSNIMLKSEEVGSFDKQEFLIFCRNYDSITSDLFLKRPTSSYVEFISKAQKIIKKTVEKMPQKKLIRKCIFDQIKSDPSSVCKFNESCQDHYNYIIIHFINCKLLRDFNWKSKNITKTRTEKTKNMLNILRNR